MRACPDRSSTAIVFKLTLITLLAASLALLAPPPAAYAATFTVNTTADTDDAAKGNGVCVDSTGACSLRAAISEANALAGADTITLPAGIYTLTITGANEGDNATGDLDVWSTITINGADASSTIIQAGTTSSNGIDRVFQVGNNNPLRTGHLILNGATVRYGKASDDGGGVFIVKGTLTLNDCILSENSANQGGGVADYYGTVNVNHSTLSSNSADIGGGIYDLSATVTIDYSTIADNRANATYSSSGGGLNNDQGTVNVSHSTFTGNTAVGYGGGVKNSKGTVTLNNTTLSGNHADYDGGGIYSLSNDAITNLAHCTLTGNTAVGYGGGIRRSTGAVNLKNTIVAGNMSETTPDDCNGIITSQGYNLVGTGCPSDGTGDQTTSNPKLGALADNGGPTLTHALKDDSLAVNAIPSGANGCGSEYTEDQRGKPRPLGGACDTGSYETGFEKIWDHGGGSSYWSTPANWSDNTLPAAFNVVVFNNTSDANATVDVPFTVAGVLVAANYDGVISQGSSNLTVNGAWTQTGGRFTGGSGVLDLNGAFDLSAGIFTAPSGLMTVSGGFHHTGGTFAPNSGRVVLDSTTDQTLATTFNDLTLNDGLLGYWKLDEGAGTAAADSSGYGHAGALQNGAAWSTDTPANMDFYDPAGLRFDGDNDYVDIAGTTDIDNLQQFTLAAWVKLDSLPAGNMRFITLRNEKAGLRYDDQALDFYVQIDDVIQHFTVSNALNANGAWVHVAGTYDGSTLRLYLNGTEQAGAVSISGTVNTGGGIHLSSDGETLHGRMDDVRVYSRALSATDIQALANGQHPSASIATTALAAALDVNGDLTLNSGTLDVSANNYAINVAGDFTRNGGVFTARSSTVTFDGAGAQTLDTDAITFHNVTVNSGSTLLTRRDFTADGTLTNNGTLQQTKNVTTSGAAFLYTGGYGGVVISGDLGSTTVAIRGNQDCTTVPDETVKRCFDIAPANTGSQARVDFYFALSELSSNACDTLNAYHWIGGAWQQLPLFSGWGGDGRVCPADAGSTPPYSVATYPVTGFSPFVLKSGSPNTIALRDFRVSSGAGERPFGVAGVITALGAIGAGINARRWRLHRKNR